MKALLAFLSFVFLSFLLLGQQDPKAIDNNELWAKVERLGNQGKPKSALELVHQIYDISVQHDNAPQFIKAVLYRLKLEADFEEFPWAHIIEDARGELDKASFPEKQILHSILAELYLNYFDRNRYKILERTAVVDDAESDFRLWDTKRFAAEVRQNYLTSIQEKERLFKIDLQRFEAIITTNNKYSVLIKPSLYDFLTNRAFEFLNGNHFLVLPEYQSNPLKYNELFYADVASFAGAAFNFDSEDNNHQCIKILQNLSELHAASPVSDALIYLDMERMRYILNRYGHDHIYEKAMEELLKTYENEAFSIWILREYSDYLMNKGMQKMESEEDDTSKYLIRAHEMLTKGLEKYPEGPLEKTFQYKLDKIEMESISFEVNDVILPEEDFLGVLEYRNVSEIFYRMVSIEHNPQTHLNWNYQSDYKYKQLLSMEVVEKGKWDVHNPGDFRRHSIRMAMKGLKPGFYSFIASSDAQFKDEESIVHVEFQVSQLSYLLSKHPEGYLDMFVMNRDQGTARSDIQVDFYTAEYDKFTRGYKWMKLEQKISDENGHIKWTLRGDEHRYNPIAFILSSDEDSYFELIPGHLIRKSKSNANTTKAKDYLFTDRSIYRPGQTIYFKGISVSSLDHQTHQLIKNEPVSIVFRDPNGQIINERKLQTNDYGSFTGSFQIPQGTLNGSFHIKTNHGWAAISVEEYKRPQFKVEMDPLKTTPALNDSVTISGRAEAYAGYGLDQAHVQYNVFRSSWVPWYSASYGPTIGQNEEMIKSGTTKTDKEGAFLVDFVSVVPEIKKHPSAVYQFRIQVEVTDINGETQFTSSQLQLSNQSVFLSHNLKDEIQQNEPGFLEVIAENIEGQKVDSKVKVELFQLQAPRKLLRKKLLRTAELESLDSMTFIEQFPVDAYGNEDQPINWKRKLIKEIILQTGQHKPIDLEFLKKEIPGTYVFSLSALDQDSEASVEHVFVMWNDKAKVMPVVQAFWHTSVPDQLIAGDHLQFYFGSALNKTRAFIQLSTKDELIFQSWETLSNELKSFKWLIDERMRGGIRIDVFVQAQNRDYQLSKTIQVPFDNKKLDIKLITQRAFLKPGAQEEWKIKINNAGYLFADAELAAVMYDASLDRFQSHNWDFWLYHQYNIRNRNYFISVYPNQSNYIKNKYLSNENPVYLSPPTLNWFGMYLYPAHRHDIFKAQAATVLFDRENIVDEDFDIKENGGDITLEDDQLLIPPPPPPNKPQLRADFRETAFFFPQLMANKSMEYLVNFQVPDALTEWKLMLLAHNQKLEMGTKTQSFESKKELMVVPNAPRFLRMGDTLLFSAKVINLSDHKIEGISLLKWYANTNLDVTAHVCSDTSKAFVLKEGASVNLSWEVTVPDSYASLTYEISADSKAHQDAERKSLAVLPNRMLVTESHPFIVQAKESFLFEWDDFKKDLKKKSLSPYQLTLEYTPNPAWYAVQALPYLMDFPHECSEQLFSRYYANALATFIANSNPRLREVVESWNIENSDALLSALEKNPELKNILLAETPWVQQAKNESQQKQQIKLLFDLNQMAYQAKMALDKLKKQQLSDGGWPWFPGMNSNQYITQHILMGIAHLQKLRVDQENITRASAMLNRAIRFTDQKMIQEYKKMVQEDKWENLVPSAQHIQYLYARSLYDMNKSSELENIHQELREKVLKHRTDYSWNLQAMIALYLNTIDQKNEAIQIMESLDEYSLYNEELGKYWRSDVSWYWYQAPIERQALMIEAYHDILDDQESIEQMKQWLLIQKRTQDWGNTRATAEAIYALLIRGSNLLTDDEQTRITLGGKDLITSRQQLGTGYLKESFTGSDIKSKMGNLEVNNTSDHLGWGALYWQYYEDLGRIESAGSNELKLRKEIFLKSNDGKRQTMESFETLEVGQRIVIRLSFEASKNLDYLHLKDMRASGLEPVDYLSGYKYGSGMGYYQSIKDASMNFFFDHLPRGLYVLEYELIVNQSGSFSNGISTIQCMYAPEFAAHTEGIRIQVNP